LDPIKVNPSNKDKPAPFISKGIRELFKKNTCPVGPASYDLNNPITQPKNKSAAFMSQVPRSQLG
jgi:hypothetical protein